MNDAPTKEELLAAGFTQEDDSVRYYLDLKENFRLYFSFSSPFCIELMVREDLIFLLDERTSKQALFDFVKLSNGKELDFTPKEKTYSWDEVFGKMDNHQKNRIDSLLHNIRNSEIQNDPLEKKLTALVKLEYIIKAIEADCNTIGGIDSVFHPVYLGGSFRNLCIEACAYTNNVSPVCSKSEEAIETLIKHHPDLIKDALGVEC